MPVDAVHEWAANQAAGASLEEWAAVVRAEYHERPCLALTRAQFGGLFGLDAGTVDAVILHLLRSGFLCESADGRLARTGGGE